MQHLTNSLTKHWHLNIDILQLNIILEPVVTENGMSFCVIPRNSLKLY